MTDVETRGRLARVADRVGMTEGQVYTSTLALLLALGSALVGLPPVFHASGAPSGFAAASPFVTDEPSTTETDAEGTPVDPTGAAADDGERPQPSPSRSSPQRIAGAPSSADDGPAVEDGEGSRTASFDNDGAPGERFTFAITAGVGAPADVAIGARGDVWSVTGGPGGRLLLHHDAAGALIDQIVVDGEGDRGLAGVAIGPAGIIVVDGASGEVFLHEPGSGAVEGLAVIPDIPPCLIAIASDACEPGPTDAPPRPVDVVVDRSGDLYVTDAGQAIIWRIPDGGDPEVLIGDAQFMGINDDGPAGMALDADGSIVVGVTASAAGGTGGAVYRIPIEDGVAGDAELVATMAPDERPRGVAVGESGSVYVALAGTGEVVVLSPDGAERDRLPETPLATPDGMAFRGGSLMVATADAGGGAIIRLPVGEVSA